MTPELERFILLARKTVYGTPFDEQDEQRVIAMEAFKLFLARKLALEVRLELFSETVWQWTPQGCSLQFTVDEQHFVLAQWGSEFALFRQPQEIPLLMLTDNAEFQDRLLIAIDDALHQS